MSEIVPQDSPQKQCAKCKTWYPANDTFFYKKSSSTNKLKAQCKKCYNRHTPKASQAPSLIEDGMKQCTKCLEIFPATSDYFHKHTRLGLQPRCRTCHLEDNKAYRDAHVTENRLRSQQYHAANRETINAKRRQYRKDNKQIINARRRAGYSIERDRRLNSGRRTYQKYRENYRKRRRDYAMSHRQQYLVRGAMRRALELNAPGTYTLQDVERQYRRQKGKCYYCHNRVNWGKHHVEHIVPLSRGGSNDPSNLVISCPTCNLKKHNKMLHEWPEGGRLL